MNNWYVIIIIIVILIAGAGATVFLLTNKNTKNNESQETTGKFTNTYEGSAINYKSHIIEGTNKWNSYITEDVNIPITYRTFYNPDSNILAYASPNSSTDLRAGGTITINTGKGAPVSGWDDVIEHEIGHVLGLPGNVKWMDAVLNLNTSNCTLDATKFPKTAAVYHGPPFNGSGDIPLASNGAHWREDIFSIELMTPEIGTEPDLKTTLLTLTAMEELGWGIDLSKAEPFS